MKSRMSIWKSGERKISLNFLAESFSQRNFIGRRDNGLFSCEELISGTLVLIFIQVAIGLWSDNEHGCLTAKFETLKKKILVTNCVIDGTHSVSSVKCGPSQSITADSSV